MLGVQNNVPFLFDKKLSVFLRFLLTIFDYLVELCKYLLCYILFCPKSLVYAGISRWRKIAGSAWLCCSPGQIM